MAKVSTYLNFPGNTREVFEFYKSVFGSEFTGGGIMQFRDIPASVEAPPVPEEDKNLVMHVELPILGGHVLMGTDAPESMGFRVTPGNNTYIQLEPDTKEEATRLFTALSEGGKVTMELQDTFWGAYYGSCTDRFGIQWMVNFAYVKP
jgi:PhnB protein